MLQKYDKTISLAALAFAALAGTAMADISTVENAAANCHLADGYSADVGAFNAEVEACTEFSASPAERAVADTIAALTERHRARNDMAPLSTRTSLDVAARAHALDMAANAYAAHTDPSGLDHLDRMRRLDRTALFGASGANITVVDARTPSIEMFNALISDPVNAANLTREEFSHAGLGVAESPDGHMVIVQVFARIDGELEAPMAVSLSAPHPADIRFTDPRLTRAGWRISMDGTNRSTRGTGEAISPRTLTGTGQIEIDATLRTETYALSGPAVSID